MSDNIVVLHYQDESSDKIWAINKVANADNSHTVWFGRRGTKLQSKKIGYKTWSSLLQSKLNKGYRVIENVTIDAESCEVSHLQATEETEEIPDALWYRVSNQIPVNVIRDYLNITIQLVTEHDAEELARLIQLPTYKALYAGKKSGGADYTEGPLALLLLFGLRRYLNDVAGPPVSEEIMQIANDGSELLPERFADIGDYVRSYAIGLFEHNGWLGNRTSGDWMEYVDGVAKQHNLSHYTSLAGIKPLAITMGCIDAPIDLAVIRTETKAAFF